MDETELSTDRSLNDLTGEQLSNAAKTIDAAFAKTFASVENTIARTAASGKTSIKSMVDAIVSDLDRIAVKQFVAQPLTGAISSLVSAILPVSGARAGGGPVSAGNAYLIGEQGPELFVPGSSGTIAANAGVMQTRPQVTLNVATRDSASFRKSEAQVTAMMLRALRRGQRNI
jgi:phage-related minor tail protein